MAKLTGSKEEIKGQPNVPEGLYTVRLDGFKPKYSKDKQSVNLQPQMKVVNHPDHNDRRIFDNLNTKAKFLWPDFCHAFGVLLDQEANGEESFPGDWLNMDGDPENWQYSGPLLGQTAQLYIIEGDDGKGGKQNKIRFYVCKIPNCTHAHRKNLN